MYAKQDSMKIKTLGILALVGDVCRQNAGFFWKQHMCNRDNWYVDLFIGQTKNSLTKNSSLLNNSVNAWADGTDGAELLKQYISIS